MKTRISFIVSSIFVAALGMLTSCENGDQEFGDYAFQTVYFAEQKPVRTITLGDDVYSTDLDNKHRFQVLCTLGGIEKNKQNRSVTVAVDNSLCDGVTFGNGEAVTPLPANYYEIQSNTVTIPAGDIWGRVEVKLTDAYFADPDAAKLTYVLPLRIVNASDSILDGMDYVLYAVKYKNKYTGCWLSHGTDKINLNGTQTTVTRGDEYREHDELRYLTTKSLTSSIYEVSTKVTRKVKNSEGQVVDEVLTLTCPILLEFDKSENCTVFSNAYTVTGSGKWEYQGAKKAWGDKDRDQITLNYKIHFIYDEYDAVSGSYVPRYKDMECNDILVMRDRQSKYETF